MGPAGVQVGVELLLLVLESLIVERGVVELLLAELLLVELVEGVEAEEVLWVFVRWFGSFVMRQQRVCLQSLSVEFVGLGLLKIDARRRLILYQTHLYPCI